MSARNHEEFKELLAPLAVHSLDDNEANAVLAHVSTCEQCRIELDHHRETAALLGSGASLPPEEVWQRIESDISLPPPPIELVRRTRPWRAVAVSVAASAATLLAVGGAWSVWPEANGISDAETELAQTARSAEGSRIVELTSDSGQQIAEVVILGDGNSFLVNKAMPPLNNNRTYQLWTISADKTISAAVLGNAPSLAAFNTSPGVEAVAITEEVSGGVEASRELPIAMAQLSSES